MECPFLKKICFKKVNQITSDEAVCESLRDFLGESVLDEDFDIPEDTIELINSSDVNKHQIYYFNSKITPPESSNYHLQIKYPKQLQTKKMMNHYAPSLTEVEEQSVGEETFGFSEITEQKNIPHILTSKMSLLTAKCEDIFHGEILLESDSNTYHCQIKDYCIKIDRDGKIRYFIEMDKATCRLDNIKDTSGQLIANRKKTSLCLNIKFLSYSKLLAFSKALELNNFQIQQQISIHESELDEKINLSNSMDSLGFEVERIEIEKLIEIGNTFDILVFKNKTMMSKVQRIFTNSDYDHVAMLLKASNREIFILQATSNVGVAVYTLESLINLPKKKYYYRVGYRQYIGERTHSEIEMLQQFIKVSMGKKYKFDPMYLISSDVKKQDTYFCSELVAEALQRCGLMAKDRFPYKYLPKHFSNDQLNESMIHGHYSEVKMLQ